MSHIFFVVGLCGVGKSTAADSLANHFKFKQLHLGDGVREYLDMKGLGASPENEGLVRDELRAQGGMAALAVWGWPHLKPLIDSGDSVVVDSLCSMSELDWFLARMAGVNVKVISIHSSFANRSERLGQRAQRKLSPTQITARDRHEILDLEKGGPIALADVHLLNDGPLDEFLSKVLSTGQRLIDSSQASLKGAKSQI